MVRSETDRWAYTSVEIVNERYICHDPYNNVFWNTAGSAVGMRAMHLTTLRPPSRLKGTYSLPMERWTGKHGCITSSAGHRLKLLMANAAMNGVNSAG